MTEMTTETMAQTEAIRETSAGAPATMTGTQAARPALVIKYCRGRLGGSAFILGLVQRARAAGRKVIVIDGDEASKTVRQYYPSGPDAALVPAGTEIADFKQLMLEQLEQMVEDRISRVVDVSGGSRDLDEVLIELDLSVFCEDNGIDLIVVAMLGAFTEDLNHVVRAIDAKFLKPGNLLLVLNRGALGKLNPDVAFMPVMDDPRFMQLTEAGATVIRMPNLPVLGKMMEVHADVYQVATTARWNGKLQPIWHNMSKRFITQIEQEYADNGLAGRLP
jgi:hypothetical protein